MHILATPNRQLANCHLHVTEESCWLAFLRLDVHAAGPSLVSFNLAYSMHLGQSFGFGREENDAVAG